MDYFNDVYLKSVNKFGRTVQDRIQGEKVHAFEKFLESSINKVTIKSADNVFIDDGVVETKEKKDEGIIDYLLVRLTRTLSGGQTIKITNRATSQDQLWIVLDKEDYNSIGYNRYTITLLDNVIKWIDKEGMIRSSFTHFVGAGARDTAIRNKFKIASQVSINLPSKEATLILPASAAITRNDKFKYNDTTWRVVGFDKESVNGVLYITLEEDFNEVGELPNSDILQKWSFSTNQGKEIALTNNIAETIKFTCWYGGQEINKEIIVESNDLTITKIDATHFSLLGENNGSFEMTVKLKDSPEICEVMPIVITTSPQQWIAIDGPKIIKVSETKEFTLNSSLENYSVSIASKNGHFTIDGVNNLKVRITGESIGKDSIIITYNNASFEVPLEIISLWM